MMFPEKYQRSLFIKTAIAFTWVYLITDTQKIGVDAAIPALSAHGFKQRINDQINPCDDFYNFVCGKTNPNLTSEYTSLGMMGDEQGFINNYVHNAILQEINSSYPVFFTMMQKYYQNCIEQEEDMYTLFEIFEDIGGFPLLLGNNWNEIAYDWKEAIYNVIDADIFIKFPFFIEIFNENLNTSRNTLLVKSGQIDMKKNFNQKISSNLIVDTMNILRANQNISEEEVQELVNFEFKLVSIMSSNEEIDARNDINTMNIESLSQKWPSIPWLKIFSKISNRHNVSLDPSQDIIIEDTEYFYRLEELINSTSKRTIANYIAWDVVKNLYPYLPKEFDELRHKYGFDQFQSRYDFCFNEVEKYFTGAIDALYVRLYVLPNFGQMMYEDIIELVENIKKQIQSDIKEAQWMDNDTREAALKKINNMRNDVGYSMELLDDTKMYEYYSELELKSEGFLRNSITVNAFKMGKKYKILYGPLERMSWTTRRSALDYNAGYKYFENAIDIPAGILQGFMYQFDRPKYLNYGALGSIIGHEITHGFDNKGRNYDENGYSRNWWSDSTEKKYMEKAQCFIDQYNNFFIPNVNLTVNGVQTLNENIADNGGFKAAYYAYNDWVERSGIVEAPLPDLNYTPKQMFWIASATNWCSKDGVEYLKQLIRTDPHPPHLTRVILSFSNIKEFAEDFQCEIGSRMNPKNKCNLW